MNKVIKSLYEQWCDTHKDTPEYNRAYSVLCVNDESITIKQENYNSDVLCECVNAESEQAFYAGFRTAVQLLTDCM